MYKVPIICEALVDYVRLSGLSENYAPLDGTVGLANDTKPGANIDIIID